jgi:hypothetical protein
MKPLLVLALSALFVTRGASAERLQIFIHFPAGDSATLDVAKRLGLQLIDDGYDVIDLRPVPVDMSATTIRYFRPELRGDADRLKIHLERLLRDSKIDATSVRVQNFSFFYPKPRANSVELWFKPE